MGAHRSCSKPRTQLPSSSSSMETNYINPNPEIDDHTHFSGAYIRNLVKQLATSSSSSSSSSSPPSTPPKTHQKSNTSHKKQVRRRLHTTKPYQERLLNMAEARKEIVTALKFHRATMKQQQQQSQPQPLPPPPPPEFTVPPIVLPNQTLGLNLSSFQDLTNLDATCLYTAAEDITSPLPGAGVETEESGEDGRRKGVGPRALGDLEMEEIKYIGDMHEMEWNDTLNLANSAWWFKFLNNMESERDFENLSPVDVCSDRQFEQAVELPLYWEGNYGNFYQPRHLELPCMNIEDIEGLDEEWFS